MLLLNLKTCNVSILMIGNVYGPMDTDKKPKNYKRYVKKLFHDKDIMLIRGRDKTKLYSLKLEEKDSVQDHTRKIIEIFDGLSVSGDNISEEDRVVHLQTGFLWSASNSA